MIELRRLSPNADDVKRMDEINRASFPPEEFIPTEKMFSFGDMDLRAYGIYADNVFSGFVTVIVVPGCVYICYFAVDKRSRGSGIGSGALAQLFELFSDRQVVVDFEAYDEPGISNAEERIRRREFYLRNGFFETGRYMHYMETEFEVACNRRVMDEEAYLEILHGIHTLVPEDFPDSMYQKQDRPVC